MKRAGEPSEYSYDGALARYINAPLNPATMVPYNTTQQPIIWSDYDGDEAYGDFTVASASPWTVTNTDQYEPGLWRRLKVGTAFVSDYLHNDMLGTLRQTTGTAGAASGSDVFTAFGERQAGSSDRYGYVGAWGYQSHGEMPYLHVGARYYDPSSGRFLQRDPIGIAGGTNVYAYVFNMPTRGIDPTGNGFSDGDNWFHDWVARNYWQRFHSDEYINSSLATAEVFGVSLVGGIVIGAPLGGALVEVLPARIAYFIRFEAHPIGGLTGSLRTMRLFHMNVGKWHLILDPRYLFYWFMGC